MKLRSLGHTIGSYQRYSGTKAYFHHGLDIRADAGTKVYSSTSSKVVNIENYISGDDLYWEVALLDSDGFVWQYHHIAKESIPEEIYRAFDSGESIAKGTLLGEIVYWPVVSYGERFHHVHLNILDKDGEYVNPMLFLKSLGDRSAPVIEGISILEKNPPKKSPRDQMRDAWKNRKPNSGKKTDEPLVAKGDYYIGVKVYDFINHHAYKVPPYKLSYRIDGGKERVFWQFDKIPGGSDINAYPDKFYVRGKTCGDYYCKRMMMNLDFSLSPKNKNVFFPKDYGSHEIEVKAVDFHGNESVRTFEFEVVPKI